MAEQTESVPNPGLKGKYARVERERRFLMAAAPTEGVTRTRHIIDRYILGTRLRLRRVRDMATGSCELKLTQKLPAGEPGHVQGSITNTYLSPAEHDLLATLPAAVLCKTRLSVPPLGVDVFEPPLHGLVLAEAEFESDEQALSFRPPLEAVAEVTEDPRFTGGRLVRARRHDLVAWLADYGIELGTRDAD
jgi:CYTH domain-containing protein